MLKKQGVIVTGVLLVLIVMVLGVSYAAFSFTRQGVKVNSITTGVMMMNYTESDNIINLNKALPTTNNTGKKRKNAGEYFDFTVATTIKGNATINFEIAALEDSSSTFSGSNVKYYLTKVNADGSETEVMAPKVYTAETTENSKTGRPAKAMSLATGSIQAEETSNYRLRLWVDENYNPQGDGGNKTYKTRVNVYGKVADNENLPVAGTMEGFKQNSGIYQYASKVTTLSLDPVIHTPASTIKTLDVSQEKNGSVMAYIIDDGLGKGTYEMHIQANGKIAAPVDSSSLLSSFDSLTNIEGMKYLDTSKTTKMQYIFAAMGDVKLDLSYFDTSNVTDMNHMFYSSSITEVDVSSFDTSKVTDMNTMFGYSSLIHIYGLENFDTSNVIDMTSMFCYTYLQKINFGKKFNTSKVTTMEEMFAGLETIETLDLSVFDTSKVTTMESMFNFTPALKCVSVGDKFVTSQAITTDMFADSGVSSVKLGSC